MGPQDGGRHVVTAKLPLPPSVNHCYRNAVVTRRRKDGSTYRQRARLLTAEAESWMEVAKLVARGTANRARWTVPKAGTKVVVEIRVTWGDNRQHDTHNLHKLIADSLEGIAYVNDRYALLRDMDYTVDPKNPCVHVTWRLHGEEPQS